MVEARSDLSPARVGVASTPNLLRKSVSLRWRGGAEGAGAGTPDGRTPAPSPGAPVAWCTASPGGRKVSSAARSRQRARSPGVRAHRVRADARESPPWRPPGFGRAGREQVYTAQVAAGGAERGRGCGGGVPRGRALGARRRVHCPAGARQCRTRRPEMTASKRVAKELEDLQKETPPYLRNLFSDDANVLVWHALLLPDQPPYHLKAFNLRISFPEEYPFKPPTVKFTTKIYHPNVDENGQVCLPIISNQNWKPCTRTHQVLEALNVLVNRPNLGEPLRVELADLLTQNPELFRRNAEEFTLRFGVDRPC